MQFYNLCFINLGTTVRQEDNKNYPKLFSMNNTGQKT